MNNGSVTKYPENFLVSNFEKMREKLLDTSGRSRLLNLDQNSRSFIRITNKQPNELAKLIVEEKVLYFKPVPDPKPEELTLHGYQEWDEEEQKFTWIKDKPDAKQWAGVLGLENNFELPEPSLNKNENEKQINTNLHSMLFEAQMNDRIKKLSSDTKLALEETGNNILFLCIGFLEWTEQADSAKKRLAPLYMLPITINKDYKKGVAVHSIKYNGEDIIQNLILREKLRHDFGLILPDIINHEQEDLLLTPEEYFSQVDELLKRKQNDVIRNWKIKRFATLATLSLGKLLMYRDLDPQNWPAGEDNLLEHQVIKRFFHSDTLSENTTFDKQSYVLDDVEDLHENYPMIEDADSSQMTVLIDVLKGKNLVVEGPPGTGKSQTITNIISAALSQGKSVLFIAEKQAALEVVKRRMDKAGLGDFCLDLHSEGAKKRLVLDDFKQRITNQSKFTYSASQYEKERQRYERTREKLLNYVQLINSEWKNTGLTIHKILMAATRYQAEVTPLKYKDIIPDNLTSDTFSQSMLEEQLSQLTLFYRYQNIVSQQLPEVGNWASHPWFGLENKSLTSQEIDEVIDSLHNWTSSLSDFVKRLMQLCQHHDIQFTEKDELLKAQSLVQAWSKIPSPNGSVDLPAVSNITDHEISELEEYISNQHQLATFYQSIGEIFTDELVENIALIEQLDEAIQGFRNLGVDEKVSFTEILKSHKQLSEIIDIFDNIQEFRNKITQHLPTNILPLLGCHFAGIEELEKFITLAAALPKQYADLREPLFDNEALFSFMPAFIAEYQELAKEQDELEQFFVIAKLPAVQMIQNYASILENTGFFSWLQPAWRQARKTVAGFTHSAKFNAKHIAKQLKKSAEWSNKHTAFCQNTKHHQLLGKHFLGLQTDIDAIHSLVSWYQKIRAEYGIGFGKRVPFAQALLCLPTEIIYEMHGFHSQGVTNGLSNFLIKSQDISKIFTAVACFSKNNIDLSAKPKPLLQAYEMIRTHLKTCQEYVVDTQISQTDLLLQIAECKRMQKIRENVKSSGIKEHIFSAKLALEPPITGEKNKDLQIVTDTLNYTKTLYEHCNNQHIVQLVKRQASIENIIDLQKIGAELSQQLDDILNQENEFFTAINSNRDRWFTFKGTSLESVVERNGFAINNKTWLDGWIKYLFAKTRMQQGGFSKLNDYLIQNSHPLEFAQNAMKFAAYYTLAREIHQDKPELSQLSGHEQTALQQQFSEYDEKLKEIQRKRVAAITAKRKIPAGMRGAKITSYTDAALLEHEINKKARHISIRNLVHRAGSAMIAYKPCFMMSPMAVAKYIPSGSLKFDIVVMDEASQVKPEDALSCFARGKQIVVVGDSKQLPPTTFFEKSLSNDSDDDTGIIEEAESILDAVSSHFDKRQLRWHYRSRHESLIEFSNHKFYDGNLVVFPSPWDSSAEFGIKFFHVEQGQFINSINKAEADIVVNAIKEHLLNNKNNESLGVVAMNAKQKELIENVLESAIRQDALFRNAYIKDSESQDPLFIKNLENVQGDERDVIYISFTYGAIEKGAIAIPQRFGPINGQSGWRRLNVLFTRAKKRIHAYSSMTADQIVLSETSNLGVKSLKAYLEFAKTGRLIGRDAISQGEPDSDFEIAVMNALSKQGFECVAQVGVAGFFIDIAVRDPGMPGRYLMGIECDGATYHSSKSTRDRDKVRQGVLEGLGWRIRRIWSTDWFHQPEAELKPIIDELRARSTPIQEKPQIDEMVFIDVE